MDNVLKCARPVEIAGDADVYCDSGGIYPPSDDNILYLSRRRERPNVLLLLTTLGGYPDTAYRVARSLRKAYADGKFTVFVHTICKSAGTLITLAADELVMSDGAHLGPLDVQVQSRDEIGEMSSGLTPTQSLATLQEESWRLFEAHFTKLRFGSRFRFSTKMAAQIAADITIGVLKPIYEQIDPIRLGENDRAMHIAGDYGERLKTKNLKERSLARLMEGYPSHSFVIDRHEAAELFERVRPPNAEETDLAECLKYLMYQDEESSNKAADVYSISRIAKNREADKMKEEEKKKDNDKGSQKTT